MRGGLTVLAVCVALAATSSGCGGGESSEPQPAAVASTTTPAPAQTQPEKEIASMVDTVHGLAPNPWKEPRPSSLRPHPHFRLDRVVVREIKRGRGPAVRAHDMVFIDFLEANYRAGAGFNRSWGGGRYATAGAILTPTGSARGLLAGMKGMRPGARRQIVAPPRLSGTEEGHADFHVFIYWDVVLRKILARGCSANGKHCRHITP